MIGSISLPVLAAHYDAPAFLMSRLHLEPIELLSVAGRLPPSAFTVIPDGIPLAA